VPDCDAQQKVERLQQEKCRICSSGLEWERRTKDIHFHGVFDW